MSSHELVVTPLETSHLEACGSIIGRSRFFQEYGVKRDSLVETLREGLEKPNYDLRVAQISGTTVGFAWLVKRGSFDRSAYLRLIAVDENHLGHGIGRTLMESLEEDYLKATDMTLLVTSDNLSARAFYERLGYGYIGTLPDYVKPNVDECLYFKAKKKHIS